MHQETSIFNKFCLNASYVFEIYSEQSILFNKISKKYAKLNTYYPSISITKFSLGQTVKYATRNNKS